MRLLPGKLGCSAAAQRAAQHSKVGTCHCVRYPRIVRSAALFCVCCILKGAAFPARVGHTYLPKFDRKQRCQGGPVIICHAAHCPIVHRRASSKALRCVVLEPKLASSAGAYLTT